MTYIIEKSKKLKFHTELRILLNPLLNIIQDYNWLITNQDYIIFDYENKGEVEKLNFKSKRIELSGEEFKNIITQRNILFIWGVFCAFKGEIPKIIDEYLPYADCNSDIWTKPEEYLNEKSEIEIICFDGTSTIVKFKDKNIEKRFLEYFPEAKLLTIK